MPVTAGSSRGGSRKLDVSIPLGGLSVDLEGNRHDLPEGLLSIGQGFDVSRELGLCRRSGGRRKVPVDKSELSYVSYLDGSTVDMLAMEGVRTAAPGVPRASVNTHPITSVIRSNFFGVAKRTASVESGTFVAATHSSLTWEYLKIELEVGSTFKNRQIVMTAEGEAKYVNWPEGIFRSLVADAAKVLITNSLHGKVKTVTSAGGDVGGGPPRILFENAYEFLRTSGALAGNPFQESDWLLGAGPLWSVFAPGHTWDGVTSPVAGDYLEHFSLLFEQIESFDKRGAWVTNGRNFWLLQNGKYTHYLDLGSDTCLGIQWRGSQVSPSVFLFTSTSHPPVVIRLSDDPVAPWASVDNPYRDDFTLAPGGVSEVHVIRSLAGVLPPELHESMDCMAHKYLPVDYDSPPVIGGVGDTAPTFEDTLASAGTISGGERITEGVSRVAIRLFDEVTGAVSRFSRLQVLDTTDLGKKRDLIDLADVADSDSYVGVVSAWMTSGGSRGEFTSPYKPTRATHVEFWRSSPGGTTLYLEYRKPLTWNRAGYVRRRHPTLPGEFEGHADFDYSTMVAFVDGSIDGWDTQVALNLLLGGTHIALNRNTDSLIRYAGYGGEGYDHELRAGELPPAAKDVASFDGVTVMGGAPSHRGLCAIIQGKWLHWPRLKTSGRLMYSEVSGGPANIKPESFHPDDEVLLTRSGDDFRAIVAAGRSAVAVFGEGAYSVRLTFDQVRSAFILKKKTIGVTGVGTPFPETVLSVDDRAMWVTPSGLFIYSPSSGSGSPLNTQSLEQWVAEVMESGDFLVAGFNEKQSSFRVRRMREVEQQQGAERVDGGDTWSHDGQVVVPGSISTIPPIERIIRDNEPVENQSATGKWGVHALVKVPPVDIEEIVEYAPNSAQEKFVCPHYGVVEDVVINLKTGRIAQEASGPGGFFVSSPFVEVPTAELSAGRSESDRQYAITGEGDVFEVDPHTETIPYPGKLTYWGRLAPLTNRHVDPVSGAEQWLTSSEWDGGDSIISGVNRASGTSLMFDPDMVGDYIYFFRDGFDGNSGPIYGQSLPVAVCRITAATVQQVEHAPVCVNGDTSFAIGRGPMRLRWAPYIGASYGTVKTIERLEVAAVKSPASTSTNELMLRSYVNYGDAPKDVRRDVALGADKSTASTHSALIGQGNAVEIEVEVRDPALEPRLAFIEMGLREDGDSLAIASGAE